MVNKIMKEVHWQIIANYMESNKDFACGNISVVTGKTYKKMWQELADKLNSAGYGEKSVKKWQKSWSDFKFALKKKASKIITGEESQVEEKLSETELKILSILGDDFCNGVDDRLQNSDETSTITIKKRPLQDDEDDIDAEEIEITKEDHDYLFLNIPHQTKKIRSDNNVEQMYENTISLLETINHTLDTRLTELNTNINNLADVLQKNAENNATICNVAASIAASSEVMAKVTADFISYFRDKKQ